MNEEKINGNAAKPSRSPFHKKSERDSFFAIRNVLNIFFMLLAIVGVVFYLTQQEQVGVIIVLVAMVFKMIECVLRFLR